MVERTDEAELDRETPTVEREWVRAGRFVTCPWRGRECDVATGACLSDPSVRLPTDPVRVVDGRLVVSI